MNYNTNLFIFQAFGNKYYCRAMYFVEARINFERAALCKCPNIYATIAVFPDRSRACVCFAKYL